VQPLVDEPPPLAILVGRTQFLLQKCRACGALRADGTVDEKRLARALRKVHPPSRRPKLRTTRVAKTWGQHRPVGLSPYPTKG